MAELLNAQVSAERGRFRLAARFTLTGSWTVLFGPSGAGKSTLLRLLAGLDTPFHARVVLHGRVLTDTAAGIAVAAGTGSKTGNGRRIGFVTQQAALFPHLSVRANVAFGLAGWARGERDARVAEMLTLFGAERLSDRKPAGLSGGEQQRIALARALAPRPELLLLDEPFAALDAAARTAMMAALRESGVPVLYVSHDLADAWQANAEALVLEAGRVVARGEARVVLEAFRARLLEQLR